MTKLHKHFLRYGITISLVTVIGVYAFFANEARKEVYFLCGNFTAGVSEDSVKRQLSTAHLASYSVFGEPVKKIEFSSWLHAHWVQCQIVFDHGVVKTARYTFAM